MTRRRTQILELLTVRETPRRLSDLAGDLSVSDRTLRRDIAWLQAGGHDIRIERGRVKYVRLSSPGTLTASDATSRRSQIGPDKSVERASELSSAFDDLAAVQGGATRILVVSGEAGVGKTRLVTQITESASDRDFFVATGRATLDEGAPGFWPIVQLIRSLTDHPEKNGAGDLANDGNNLVSELMPVLATPGRGRLSNGGELHAIRFRLFDRVTRFVSLSAAISPVSLVIDDLQWANPATLDLVRYISSSLIREPVLIAVTVRGGEVDTGGQLRRTLAELFRHPGHRRIALSGLTREGVRRLIEIRTRQSGRPFVTDYVHALTRGNPFFIRELVEHLISRDLMDAGSIDDLNTRRVLVPESVQDILEARLRSLPDETVAVLEMASLIGTEFEIELLSQVVSEDLAGALKSALDHGAAAGLIEDQDAQIGRMAFAHPLTQVAFVERQTPTKRAAGHLGIADAMEPLGEQPSNLNDAELAHHLERAGTLAEPERLAHYAMRAGDHAMSTSAWADALRHFEVVIAALDRQDSTDSEMVIRSRARALDGAGFARLARMSTYSSQSPGFYEMNEAFELYLQLGDRGAAIALASHGWRWGWQTPLDRTKERALDLVEPGSLGYGWLISGYGFHIAYGEGEVVRASALINEALEIARENGSRQLEARALVDLMHVTWLTGDDEMSASTYRDAHRTAFDLCEDQFVAHIGLIGAIAMARVGNIDEAIRTGEETL